MINWFRKENYTGYEDKLRDAFPKTMRSDLEAVLSILPFDDNNVKRTGQQIIKVDNLIFQTSLTVYLDSELLCIPYRIYFNEPDIEQENELTDIQKTILNCIYLRHFDGYLRQRRLENLIDKNDNWIIPFTIQLLGEYVFEILEVLDRHINDKTIDSYVKFIRENPKYWEQTESRMISYWNEDYRRQYPKLKIYLGRQLANRIKKSERMTAHLQ
jgi:hypothetical protein